MAEAAARPRKVSIGFSGGQILAARLAPDELESLRKALGDGGWHQLRAEDGEVSLDLAQVVYVLTDTDEHRVGF